MAEKKVTRSKKVVVWLIGGTEETFKPSKLPSRGEVLKVLFHYHLDKKFSLKDSIRKTTELLLTIWENARIPTKSFYHVVEHIRKLHSDWQGLKKDINRTSETNLAKQQSFRESFDDLFDVAHRDALTLIKIQEDREFLQAQREKGRRGIMLGLDRSLALKEERVLKRKTAAANRSMKAQSEIANTSEVVVLEDDDSNSSHNSAISEPMEEISLVPKVPRRRGTVAIVNPEVAAALDRTNTSDRKAAHILTAIASTNQFHQNVENLIINRSSIRRARMDHRSAFMEEIKATFDPTVPLILHWDGKILEDFADSSRQRVDRLPILVSGQNVVKLLSVPKLNNGKAELSAETIIETIDEWGLRDRVTGLCFDTTATNTGHKGGICVLLEEEIGREMLHLACRHHASEIILEKVFSLHDVSRSPNMEIFGHFRDYWPQIDQTSFVTALEDPSTVHFIATWKDGIIKFAEDQLLKHQPRDDYLELLELSIIFLGGVPPRGVRFRRPGAIHRARWMARAIYSIKMWLFRNQYIMQQRPGTSRGQSQSERVWDHLKRVCLFVTSVYVKYWFLSPLSTAAPRNDLNLLQALSEYPDREVAEAATTAFGRHLWYLSELLIGFGFFDDEVSSQEKRKMVMALKENESSDEKPPHRIKLFRDPNEKGLHDFVTTNTYRLFKILDLSEEILEKDPSEWGNMDSYRRGQERVQSIKVVNDLAERGVALMQEFNSSLTRNEEQKQFLLQVVEKHRQEFSNPTKAAAIERSYTQN